ncbi:hypothetical protein P43SY_011213 [Pythium insidiosum]|uniref:Transmembrane protein n=1 Tax=Pythium insidiosum TaxID=114742 RepID=A0AAD5L6H2_PYTIN|nr:hypothetical protein P43SY_011213 [Pythium insidiosum]
MPSAVQLMGVLNAEEVQAAIFARRDAMRQRQTTATGGGWVVPHSAGVASAVCDPQQQRWQRWWRHRRQRHVFSFFYPLAEGMKTLEGASSSATDDVVVAFDEKGVVKQVTIKGCLFAVVVAVPGVIIAVVMSGNPTIPIVVTVASVTLVLALVVFGRQQVTTQSCVIKATAVEFPGCWWMCAHKQISLDSIVQVNLRANLIDQT